MGRNWEVSQTKGARPSPTSPPPSSRLRPHPLHRADSLPRPLRAPLRSPLPGENIHLGSAAFVSKTKNRKSRSMQEGSLFIGQHGRGTRVPFAQAEGGRMSRRHRASPPQYRSAGRGEAGGAGTERQQCPGPCFYTYTVLSHTIQVASTGRESAGPRRVRACARREGRQRGGTRRVNPNPNLNPIPNPNPNPNPHAWPDVEHEGGGGHDWGLRVQVEDHPAAQVQGLRLDARQAGAGLVHSHPDAAGRERLRRRHARRGGRARTVKSAVLAAVPREALHAL